MPMFEMAREQSGLADSLSSLFGGDSERRARGKLMRTSLIIGLLAVLLFFAAAATGDDRPLMGNYRGAEKLPDALYETYVKLIKAMEAGKEDDIRRYCLPWSVEI